MDLYAHIATNVRRLRQNSEYSLSALAERSGISVSGIKKIESGAHRPTVKTLTALAQAFGVSVFELTCEHESIDAVRFRARKRTLNKRDRRVIIDAVARWIHDYAFLEKITGTSARLDRAPFKGLLRSPEKLAAGFREVFEIGGDLPVCDPCALLERAGIKILFYKTRTGFSGLSVSDGECGDAVIINDSSEISTEHKIFTTFHEVGHLLMHLTGYNAEESEENPQEEAQADTFASYLLMPREAFRAFWGETRGIPFLDRVYKTKQYFRVSYRTVLKRLTDEKLASKDIWITFAQLYNRSTGKDLKGHHEPESIEPENLSRYGFWEDRFARLVFDAGVQEKISISKGAGLLKIPVTEFRNRISRCRAGNL